MKTNTHIAVVLDRSGSMDTLRKEIIGGFNAFLADQKKVPGTATITLVQFDHDIDRMATFKPLAEMEDLTEATYQPRGCTKLYDAIGLTVNTTKEEIAKAAEKPEKVLIVILTDGLENSSQEYTTDSIRALLDEQQKTGWEFTFIGANQDAILSARGIGLHNAASNITYAATPAGAMNMMASLSRATASFRCGVAGPQGEMGPAGPASVCFSYDESDRKAQAIDPAAAYAQSSKAVFTENGSKAGSIGGPARAASLSPKQRTNIARTAAKARWSGKSI